VFSFVKDIYGRFLKCQLVYAGHEHSLQHRNCVMKMQDILMSRACNGTSSDFTCSVLATCSGPESTFTIQMQILNKPNHRREDIRAKMQDAMSSGRQITKRSSIKATAKKAATILFNDYVPLFASGLPRRLSHPIAAVLDIERLSRQLWWLRPIFRRHIIAQSCGRPKTITSSKYMVPGTTLIFAWRLPIFGMYGPASIEGSAIRNWIRMAMARQNTLGCWILLLALMRCSILKKIHTWSVPRCFSTK